MRITFGQKLKQVREAAGWKQARLADVLGVEQPAISKLEKDHAKPTVEQIKLIAEAFGISLWSLVGGTDEAARFPGECLVTITGENASVKWLGYFASGLTGLSAEDRAVLQTDADIARSACEGIQAYLYEPAQFTDPVRNKDLPAERVYEIDHAQVSRSHFVVLDARFPSFGAGQEIEIATNAGIPVVLLKPVDVAVSRMVAGTYARLIVVEFASPGELRSRLDSVFTQLVAEIANLYRAEQFALAHRAEGETLGARLRRIRTGMKLDESTLARLVGLSPHAIRQYEADVGNPSTTLLHRIAAVLHTSVAHLIEGVATRLEETDTTLRKSKENLIKFAEETGMSVLDFRALWEPHAAEYQRSRRLVAEARSDITTGSEWKVRYAALKSGAPREGRKQVSMFDGE